MFNDHTSQNNFKTKLSEKCTIKGTLSGTGYIEIDGFVDGDIFWDEDLITKETSYIKGNVHCIDCIIKGRVDGNIFSKGTVYLEESSIVNGNITTLNLVIKTDALFNGRCSMKPFKHF